ncbi:MAG: HEAT repeat domain-containing protein, partial [Phycisphaerae bacterium]|nr:HEAT repeat domain-containing protein [Phycisphaerae bacterium]
MSTRQRAVTAIVLALAVSMLVAGPLRAADHTKIIGYKFGESRVALAAIEDEIRTTKDTRAIEAELLKALNSPKATFECKQFVCRMLRRIGTETSVPSLAKLLTDEKLSNMARFALQGMAGASVDSVLNAALAKTTGQIRIGMIGTIAARGDAKAVPALSKLLADKDTETARAAIAALGKIGGADAAKALDGAKIDKSLQAVADDAALSCAESLIESGDTKAAAKIYKNMFEGAKSTAVRIAALGGIARSDKSAAAPIIASLLSGKDKAMQRLAAKLVNEVTGAEATKVFAGKLPNLPADVQVIVITALASRGDKGAAPAVTAAAASKDAAVRTAALDALGSLGDASSVTILARALPAGGSDAAAAGGSLTGLRGDGVGAAIIKALGSDNAAVRASLVKILAARREKEATPAVLKIAGSDKESTVRRAAFKALGTLGAQSDVPQIASMLVATESSSDRAGLANTILQVSERCPDADKRSAPVISVLGKADDKAKSVLLVVLSRLAGDKAYAAIKSQLASGSDDVKKASVRALAAWPDATPADTLLSVATSDSDAARKVLAMRGYIRVITIPGEKAPTAAECKAKTALLGKGLKVAGPSEKKQILAALASFPCPAGLAIAQGCAADKTLANEAKLATSKIKWALARPAAKASASRGGDKAALAIDGVRKTLWTTGGVMNSGDSFTLTLPAADSITGVTLDCGVNMDDYPREYELFVS